MNRYQRIAVAIAAANLLLILLFPPYDQQSISPAFAPAFAGFHFAFSPPALGQLNSSMLTLEIAVVLVNISIALLLLRDRKAAPAAKPNVSLQNGVLIATGVNLVLMLLFPPFATADVVPATLDGFRFIFNQGPDHAISIGFLYIEVAFILVNGGLFWLSFNEGL
jgi:hypothetical protein